MSPSRTPTGFDLAHDMQRLSMSRSQSTVPALNNANTLLSTPIRSSALQVQPTYGMVPVVYHGIPMATPPYVLDGLSSRSHSAAFSPTAYPPSTSYSFLSPMASRNAYIPRDMVVTRPFSGMNRRQHATRVSRSPFYQQANNHNHVDVNRIREGTDVRTTVSSETTVKGALLTIIDHVAKYTQ